MFTLTLAGQNGFYLFAIVIISISSRNQANWLFVPSSPCGQSSVVVDGDRGRGGEVKAKQPSNEATRG